MFSLNLSTLECLSRQQKSFMASKTATFAPAASSQMIVVADVMRSAQGVCGWIEKLDVN